MPPNFLSQYPLKLSTLSLSNKSAQQKVVREGERVTRASVKQGEILRQYYIQNVQNVGFYYLIIIIIMKYNTHQYTGVVK